MTNLRMPSLEVATAVSWTPFVFGSIAGTGPRTVV